MTKRHVIKMVLQGEKPPYVPWSFAFTVEAHEKLVRHFGRSDCDPVLHNHLLWLGDVIDSFEDLGDDRFKDVSSGTEALTRIPAPRQRSSVR